MVHACFGINEATRLADTSMHPKPTPTTLRHRMLAAFGVGALALSLWSFIGAPTGLAHADEKDHELARRALQEGKVLPLRTVLEQVEREYKGQVLEVELERDGGSFIYEIKLLLPDGRLMKLEVDGATGKVVRTKYKNKNDDKEKGRH
ncbi:hypothetical protein SDC9_118216 [bioreactor metagenome]|uniref:PepSY domain-containing protein n=1 Tax=bioreactor metagenome TaxID=1076179 RepID=A0A645C7E6_9ZZZZ